ncbi:MAG: thioredoxin domain-containing protein [Myxococcota bacterium]
MGSAAARRLLAGTLLLMLLACGQTDRTREPEADSDESPHVAELNGRAITLAELDAWLKDELWRQQVEESDPSELYRLRSDGLERMITDRLLEAEAQRRGMSREELLAERAAATGDVSEEAVSYFCEQNRTRLGGASLEQIAPRIREYLAEAQRTQAIQELEKELRDSAGLQIHLEPPRVDVAARGPSRGPEDAPVTLIEFSDYQCPFCRRAEPTVAQVLERYGDRVRFIFRHYPLEFHDRARPAAEAAACAEDQGRFWEYHERLFAAEGVLSDADLERIAKETDLDLEAFRSCLSEHHALERVNQDVEEGTQAGVNGTPAFFINGIPLSGAQPLEAFTRLIDRELAKAGASASGS